MIVYLVIGIGILIASLIVFNKIGDKSEVEYKSVKIGNVLWMTENLKVKTFSNGDPIPEANTKESWEAAVENGTPAWCYYNFDPAVNANIFVLKLSVKCNCD